MILFKNIILDFYVFWIILLYLWIAYYVKIDVRCAEVYNSRFTNGLYVQYGCTFAGELKDHYKTKSLTDTLQPNWSDSRLTTIEKVTDEIIEAFESDSITFTLFGVQKDSGNAPKVRNQNKFQQ